MGRVHACVYGHDQGLPSPQGHMPLNPVSPSLSGNRVTVKAAHRNVVNEMSFILFSPLISFYGLV